MFHSQIVQRGKNAMNLEYFIEQFGSDETKHCSEIVKQPMQLHRIHFINFKMVN